MKIDLHIHSTASDGKLSPKELIDLAIDKKLLAIALTDHNTTRGNNEALEYAKGKNIRFIPGIEISITPPKDCKELHMVGLFIDSDNKGIQNMQKRNKISAEEVRGEIIRKLNHLGYEITLEELLKENGDEHFGRPFIARVLMRKYPDEFKTRKEVFDKLLGSNKGKAFVASKGASMEESIEMIHNAGGIAIIAHPWYLGECMENVINQFIKFGGDGIEREYGLEDSIPEETGKILDRLIKDNNLIVSGGTDFHESTDEVDLGDRGISREEFEKMIGRVVGKWDLK